MQPRPSSRPSVTLALACAVGIAAIAGSAAVSGAFGRGALPRQAAPAPVNIALVDLARLMDGLQELKDRNETVKVRAEELGAALGELDRKIKQIDADLKSADIVPESARKRRGAMFKERFESQTLLEARNRASKELLEFEKGDIIREVYLKVVAGVDAFAKQEGFDIVMLDDRAMQLPSQASMRDFNQIIVNKRVLFAREGLDVTDRLVTVMNNDYAASVKGKAGN